MITKLTLPHIISLFNKVFTRFLHFMMFDQKYDVIIIGSGLGGLLCAALLGMQGKKVVVIEKNKQAGGNLQTFSRNKQLFDTGVHYIGGLDKGQTLYQIFKYATLIPRLKLEKMDACFDKIYLGTDETSYCLSQGYETFIKNLSVEFPNEAHQITVYCQKIKEVCASFPLYRLQLNESNENLYKANNESAQDVIASITSNKTLQAVLAGNHILYAGCADKTPFHVHALITNSYIESSWKCVGGGSQIAKILSARIREMGGEIVRNKTVTGIKEVNGVVAYVQTDDGQKYYGAQFVSNVHPATTLGIIQSSMIKAHYKNRILNLEQTLSSFSAHLVLKPQTIPYQKSNFYYHKNTDVWQLTQYEEANWPMGYGLYYAEDRQHKGFAATISILTPMRFDEVQSWSSTHNRAGKECSRGADYEAFKNKKAKLLLQLAYKRFPELEHHVTHIYTSTPLTNRDYLGDATGSMYGAQKDYKNPMKTMISPRTKIPNLFLTGQNLNLHGILGTSLSAVLTCMMMTGDYSLIHKIKNA